MRLDLGFCRWQLPDCGRSGYDRHCLLLFQIGYKLLVLSLQGLDLLLERHLDGLHHRRVFCDERRLAGCDRDVTMTT